MGRGPRFLLAFAGAFLALFLTHYPILPLPFYWDELGQFVPAALDIYHRLAWVPYSAVPNVHPPGLMSYLALAWRIAGFSVAHTRIAMLLLAAAALLAQWNLARVLSRDVSSPGSAAWMATLFLFVSPLFFAQAAMAQLDMPAMLVTTLALTAFLEERFLLSALLCTIAVMTKETAIVAPALFGFVLLRRRLVGSALLFLLPLIPLLAWLFLLYRTTGQLFGSPEFAAYNLWYPLHPVRLVLALLRRAYYLFISSGHLIGTIAVLVWLRALAKRPGASPAFPAMAARVRVRGSPLCGDHGPWRRRARTLPAPRSPDPLRDLRRRPRFLPVARPQSHSHRPYRLPHARVRHQPALSVSPRKQSRLDHLRHTAETSVPLCRSRTPRRCHRHHVPLCRRLAQA